jgi:hypothetical protein
LTSFTNEATVLGALEAGSPFGENRANRNECRRPAVDPQGSGAVIPVRGVVA